MYSRGFYIRDRVFRVSHLHTIYLVIKGDLKYSNLDGP